MVYLWDIIREFFVRYIFGGTLLIDGNYDYFGGFIGSTCNIESLTYNFDGTQSFYVPINGFSDGGERTVQFLSIGDWLSTTATIITLVALLIGISCLMVSLFRWIVRLVSLRG